jgi:lysophospholipase L1-like esterase
MKTLLVEGASTAFGMHDYERGGWAARLHLGMMAPNAANMIDPTIVVNRAIPGNSLPAILRTAEEDTARFLRIGPVTTILSVGMNEAKIHLGLTRPVISLERFRHDLDAYASIGRQLGVSTVYVGPQPVNEPLIRSNGTGSMIEDDLVEEYGLAMAGIAHNSAMPFVDPRALFAGYELSDVLNRDGYHPNALGHAILHGAIQDALKQIHALPEGV